METRPRLAFDYRVMMALSGPMIRGVRGFVSSRDRSGGREASASEGGAGRVTQYLVSVERPMLAGPGRPLGRAELLLDTTVAPNYPFGTPTVHVVSQPLPFTPRVHASGLVCLGGVWSGARGRMLLGHLVVHVLRLLGFDEPPNTDQGFNPLAYRYWREVLRDRPLPCPIPYPALPDELTHARPSAAGGAFVPVGSAGLIVREGGVFRARSSAAAETPAHSAGIVFRPAGSRS